MLEGARLLTAGYSCMLHVHSLATMCSWDKVLLFYATCLVTLLAIGLGQLTTTLGLLRHLL